PFFLYYSVYLRALHSFPTRRSSDLAQILMIHQGVRYLYTGDYKMQADPTCEPLQYAQADVLITESTFAKPSVTHPDPVEEIRKLNSTPYNILLGTYGLGKAQRLTDLI